MLYEVITYDRPQQGRYREHWQANFDIFGEQDAVLDAQMIQLAHRLVTGIGIKSLQFQINSIVITSYSIHYTKLYENNSTVGFFVFLFQAQGFQKMPGNGFSFAVFVGCQNA